MFIYFNIGILDSVIGRKLLKRWPAVRKAFHVISSFSGRELLVTLLLSATRYVIFTLQMYLLFLFFEIPVTPGVSLIITSVMFFVMSIIPTIALSELGLRGSVSLFLFGFYFTGAAMNPDLSAAIVAASALLWLINLALPTVAGTFFVYQLKFFRRRKG